MKIALIYLSIRRAILWLALLPWLVLVALFVVAALSNSRSAVTEAFAAAMGCAGAFLPYAALRALDKIGERAEAILREWQ